MSSESELVCQTCYVSFPERDILKEHYTTVFHAYNAKRRSGGLAPVTFEAFEARRQAALARAEAATAAAQPKIYRVVSSGRDFSSLGALVSHLRSKRVQAELAELPDATDADLTALQAFIAAPETASLPPQVTCRTPHARAEEPAGGHSDAGGAAAGAAAGEDGEPVCEDGELPRNHPDRHLQEQLATATIDNMCFLDCHPVGSAVENLDRCCSVHGFHIPDEAYLTDVMGLLQYCAEKVIIGMTCLYCDATFNSVTATQAHMAAKRHGKLPFDRDHGRGMAEYDEFYDFTQEITYKGSKGQDVVPIGFSEMEVDEDGHLILPDGRSLGHRAYKQYYKQHIAKPDMRTAVVAAAADRRAKIAKALETGNSEALIALGMARRHDHISGLSKWVASSDLRLVRMKLQRQLDDGQRAELITRRKIDVRHGAAGNRNQRIRFVQQYMGAG